MRRYNERKIFEEEILIVSMCYMYGQHVLTADIVYSVSFKPFRGGRFAHVVTERAVYLTMDTG